MDNVFYPKVEKTTLILLPDHDKKNICVHVVLPKLLNDIKAISVNYLNNISNNEYADIYTCTTVEEYNNKRGILDFDHECDTFILRREYNYIRLPKGVKKGDILHIVINNDSFAKYKVLQLEFIESDEKMAFSDDVIWDNRAYTAVDYFGEDKLWKPKVAFRYIVSGHENCDFGECGSGCKVVSCGIQQGYGSPEREEVYFLRATI